MPELRKDPFSTRWIIFSPERLKRPMSHYRVLLEQNGEGVGNPFLPGNEHETLPELYAVREANSESNGPGWSVRVVPNKFPALRREGKPIESGELFRQMNGYGAHEVVIETNESDLSLEEQKISGIVDVLSAFRTRMRELVQDPKLAYLFAFKNSGPRAGATIPHPHSQIIALPIVPGVVAEKLSAAREYQQFQQKNLFADVLERERKENTRMVYENNTFSAFCPFASRFAYEVCIMSKVQQPDFFQESDENLCALAEILKEVLQKYRRGLDKPDYNLIFHTAPIGSARDNGFVNSHFRWHLEIFPRIFGVAGFEFGTDINLNAVLPEEAARTLKEA